MIVEYKVYKKSGVGMPIISYTELSRYQIRGKRKYIGKAAKIEAVFRLTKKILPPAWTTKQVESYIASNFFKKPIWGDYYRIFKEVSNEVVPIHDVLEFQYILIVEFEDKMDIGLVADERVIYLLTSELMGKPLKSYEGVENLIVSLRKKYLTC